MNKLNTFSRNIRQRLTPRYRGWESWKSLVGHGLLCCCLALSSCYDDLGNYEYHELETVDIDTAGTGMQSEYAIMRFDTLVLSPKVYFEGEEVTSPDQAPLDYQWTIFSATSGTGANAVIDTIGHERVLNAVISRTGGNYLVQLTVTNRNDGIRQFFRIPVAVSEVFDGGWMVFYERADKPGYSDLALIYNPWTKLNVNYNRYYLNLYETTNGEPLRGHPIRCLDIAVSLASGNNYVGLCTDYTLMGVSENGIEKALEFNEFFHEAPSTMAPTWYGQHGSGVMSGQSSEVLINDNHIYTNTYSFSATEGRNTRFGVPKIADGIGTLAPWNAEVPHTLNYGIVVYDQTNHCFRYAAYNSARLETFAGQAEDAVFDINNTGMELIMGDWGRGASMGVSLRPYDYLLMSRGDERYLAVTNFATTGPQDNNIAVGLYPLNALCPGITEATSISSSHVGNFIYYSSGNKVYDFAYDSQQPATVAWEAETENELVTCVRIMKYYHGTIYGYGMVPTSDNLIHIATWNPETSQGRVYEYLINPASGILNTENHYEYPIPGRVKDMAWKFSMQ
ncbi:MAG: hypothetical protein K6F94_02805 [Bacteroidaceae bacterium]|nr:hypothetical protein [Bacteroidaceae bacterium]